MVFGRGARVYLAPLFWHASGNIPDNNTPDAPGFRTQALCNAASFFLFCFCCGLFLCPFFYQAL